MKAAIALLVLAAAHAHEIGTTRVSASFDQREYHIEIITDAAALLQKLSAVNGSAPPDGAGPVEFQALLKNFDASFRQRVQIAFDAVDVRPAIEYAVKPGASAAAGATAIIHLNGPLPQGARCFTWNYGWTFASYSIAVRNGATPTPSITWLEGNESSPPFALMSPAPPQRFIAWRYLLLGFTHIVPKGLDHILFVLGIYLLRARVRAVLSQVSAFTVAHSITLGLSMYGLIAVPPRIVEPMIAISIAYVGIENIFLKEVKPWRVALIFAFGLLHGMGFAGALKEVGLPHSEFLVALLSFNVGVEAGQLAVIAAAFLFFGWHCARRTWYRSRVIVPASTIIACTAVCWTVQRLLG